MYRESLAEERYSYVGAEVLLAKAMKYLGISYREAFYMEATILIQSILFRQSIEE